MRSLSGPILIVRYDPRRPEWFAREAARIRSVLGAGALRIEHAGSTAVQGLAAKPIEAAGYVLRIREPDWRQHRVLKGPDTDINLRVFSAGCPEIERMLMFRDWLRLNASDRDLYERTKRTLAEKEWRSVQNYADAKTAVIDEIIARATADRT